MIVEMRTYTLTAGSTRDYLRLMQQKGIAMQKAILGNLIGFYAVDIGELNKVIHLWGFDDFEDRSRRRSELWASSEWLAFVSTLLPIVLHQKSEILIPAPFMALGANQGAAAPSGAPYTLDEPIGYPAAMEGANKLPKPPSGHASAEVAGLGSWCL